MHVLPRYRLVGSRAWARLTLIATDRTSTALSLVFLLAALFYLWTASTTYPGFAVHAGSTDRYNLLASALLHFHLWIGKAPAALLHLSNPYEPAQNSPFVLPVRADVLRINDDVLYGKYLYFTWGPAPALVFLVPLHILGFEPSSSVTVFVFATAGLGFALATLRLILRQLEVTSIWMCVLAGLALALSNGVPFILSTPSITEDVISGGLCFTMAGVWLASLALVSRQASLKRVALISLCFGLAAGSRPTLALTSLLLIPVYLALRRTRSLKALLTALLLPIGTCLLLLLAYNQARFGQPLEIGARYTLSGFNPRGAPFDKPESVLPGLWFYTFSLPRISALFPFLILSPPPAFYPGTLPSFYASEITSGLLTMTPILIFLPVLPWIWRRRRGLLGHLGSPLLLLMGSASGILVGLTYTFFATTQRYEVDFTTLFLLGALTGWLALSTHARPRYRRLLRVGGGLLIIWGCLTGVAISFISYGNYRETDHHKLWSNLETLSSPISTAIAIIAGGPILANVSTPYVLSAAPTSYTDLTTSTSSFTLLTGGKARLSIVSPDRREAALVVNLIPGSLSAGSEIQPGGATSELLLNGPGHTSLSYPISATGATLRIPVRLRRGLNHLGLSALAGATKLSNPNPPGRTPALFVRELSLAGHY
jgi:hypothetical protein